MYFLAQKEMPYTIFYCNYFLILIIGNTITGEDFPDMDEHDFKEVFQSLALRKIVKGVYNCVTH